jgi:hypothetical protein
VNLNDVGKSESEGNPKEFKGWALVAFIDLLGFSADVLSSWNASEDAPLDRLLRIKAAASEIRSAGILSYVRGGPFDPKVHKARVHTVSDSIVVAYALPSAGNLYHLGQAMTVVSNGVQMAWAAALRNGYTARGAMELGEIYWTEHETIGPALVTSYWLESKIAKDSRVILGPCFLENILRCMNDDWSDWPLSEWFSVSYDGLIEISLHRLKEDLKGNLDSLEVLQQKAGPYGGRYDHILKTLRADRFKKASRNDFEHGKVASTDKIKARTSK